MELDNISFKNTSDLKRVEVSKPIFSTQKEFKFFYSDNEVYYKYFDINDNSNIKNIFEK